MSNFENLVLQMQKLGMKLPSAKTQIQIKDAKALLTVVLNHFLQIEGEGRQLVWLPEYDEVAKWLTDNQGRGLYMYGNCGRGKSLLCRYVLPAILLSKYGKVASVFDIQDMNKNIDSMLSKHIICLDDIGTEEVANHYGNKRLAFAEVMDAAEKNGKLVIISTNLQADEIRERYGDRILDRILATTTRVLFAGNSLRDRGVC